MTSILSRWWGTLLLLGGLGFFLWRSIGQLTPYRIPLLEDQALTLAVLDRMIAGELALLGPPSHIGGRHLGPLFYYVSGAAYWLVGGDPYLLALVWSVAVPAALVLFTWAVLRHRTSPSAILAIAGVLVLLTSATSVVTLARLPWHGHFLLLPSLLLGWLILHRAPSLGSIVLVYTICLQSHFSFGPALAASALLLLPKMRCLLSQAWTKPSLLQGGIAMLLWVPPLLWELLYPSNVSHLATTLSSPKEAAGILASMSLFISWVSSGLAPRATSELLIFGGLFLGVGVLLRAELLRRAELVALLLPMILTLLAVARQEVPLHPYYFSPLWFLPIAFFCFGALGISTLLRSQARALFVCTTVVVILIATVPKPPRTAFARYHSLAAAKGIAAAIKREFRQCEPEILTFGHARLLRDGILQQRSPDRLFEIKWSHTLREFEGTTPAPARCGVALFCPLPDRASRAPTMEILAAQWENIQGMDLSRCGPACRSCGAFSLRRPRRNASATPN